MGNAKQSIENALDSLLSVRVVLPEWLAKSVNCGICAKTIANVLSESTPHGNPILKQIAFV